MYAAVLFDMDGLLLDTERVYMGTFHQAATEVGLTDTVSLDAIFRRMVGLRAKDSNSILVEEIGPLTDLDRFKATWQGFTTEALVQDIPVQHGVPELLGLLKDQGTPCAVATSTRTSHAIEHLERAGLGAFFDLVVGGEQVLNGKPDPEIYLRAASGLGVSIVECAAFEDSNTGIQAAVASGAWAVQVPDVLPPTDQIRALGHTISDTIMSGAREIGLIK